MRVLETERTYLREWTVADLDAAIALYSDREVMRFMHTRRGLTAEECGERMAAHIHHQTRHGFCQWAAVLRETDEVIGHCGLRHLCDTGHIDIGWLLARRHWGQGLATEMARAALEHGHTRLTLPRIIAVALPENAASIRVMERIGMTRGEDMTIDGEHVVMYQSERSR